MAGNTVYKYKLSQVVSSFVNKYLKEIPQETLIQERALKIILTFIFKKICLIV